MAAAPPVTDATLAIANRLRPVLLHVSRHLRHEANSLGMSPGQISVLAAIADRRGIGVAELAVREGVSAPTITAHIDRLEASGCVSRVRDSDGDRRRVGLAVTPAGTRMLRAVRSRRTAWLAARLEALEPRERARISDAVDALAGLVRR